MSIKDYISQVFFKNSYFFFYGVLFFCGSFLGWVVEIPWRILTTGSCHALFMYGPFTPIYGFALCFTSFIFLFCNRILHKIFLNYNKTFWGINSYSKIFIDLLLIVLLWLLFCLIEILTGLFLLQFNIRLWDYSYYNMNFYGVIAKNPAEVWFSWAMLVYFFLPTLLIRFRQTCDWLANNDTRFIFLKYLIFVCLFLFIIDFIFSFIVLFNLFSIRSFLPSHLL